VDVSGFESAEINGRYIRDVTQTQHGESTFSKADGSVYMYWCNLHGEGIWMIAPTSPEVDYNENACGGAAKGSAGGDFWVRSTAGWEEFRSGIWEPRSRTNFLCRSATGKL
jgi:hypothetical protein